MTGILLYQHKEIITTAYPHWQRSFIQFLMQHPGWGYALYVSATVLQLSFISGFFTRRFDRVFAGLFLVFLVMDYLIMRITYFEVLGLVLPLFFSHLQPPASQKLVS